MKNIMTTTTFVLALLGAPVQASDEQAGADHPAVIAGADAYDFLCSKCHGADMVNPGTASYDLRKWPVEKGAEFKDVVLNGKGDMPAWADILEDGELEALWAYVGSRAGAGPLPPQAPDTSTSGTGD